MNKYEFLAEVRRGLGGMDKADIDRSLEYYREMIEDRVEDGISEEEAVAALGPVDKVIADIRAGADCAEREDIPTPVSSFSEKEEENTGNRPLGVLLTVLRVLYAIFDVCLWITAVSVMVAGISVCATAAGILFTGIVQMLADGLAIGLVYIGGAAAGAGIGIFTVIGAVWAFRGIRVLSSFVYRLLGSKEEEKK